MKTEETAASELDSPDLDVDSYISKLLAGSSLAGLAKTVAQLDHEVNTFDSEQKSLVYNNYKKLIRAASTLEYLTESKSLDNLEALAPQFEAIAAKIDMPLPELPAVDLAARVDAFYAAYPEEEL